MVEHDLEQARQQRTLAEAGHAVTRGMSQRMNPDSRIFVAGHRGLVGSAIVRRLEREGYRNLLLRAAIELDLRDQTAVERIFCTRTARICVPGRGQSRRHPRQRHVSRGVPPRQSAHRGQRDRRGVACGHAQAAVSRLVLHLPEVRAAADARGASADGSAGADQRMVCDREDSRHQDVPGLPPTIRVRRDQPDAHQPLRPRRQLRPARARTCCPR